MKRNGRRSEGTTNKGNKRRFERERKVMQALKIWEEREGKEERETERRKR